MTIYFGDKQVILTDELAAVEKRKELKESDKIVYMEGISNYNVQSISKEIEKPGYESGLLYHDNFEELKKHFFDQFVVIKAGGGIVRNEREEILLILRNGKWDLPKGKLDTGETIEDCALREVQEETGLTKVTLDKLVDITYHTYVEKGTRILKESYWYNMTADSSQALKPQTEEGISDIKWVVKEDLSEYLKNTYGNIENLLKKVL